MSQKRISDNKNMTPKERNLLKGAIRRVFSRSDIRRAVIEASRIEHTEPSRPRVTKWSLCGTCKKFIPTYLMVADHISPLIPVDTKLEDMTWDTVIDNTWCEKNNLMAICKDCHKIKTKSENKLRRRSKNGSK